MQQNKYISKKTILQHTFVSDFKTLGFYEAPSIYFYKNWYATS